ncbi:MAG: hypothetical protein P4M08_05180 [Oligoflexia bacterium]|nr:hypothetical protein [Oligoflexia bacterium]
MKAARLLIFLLGSAGVFFGGAAFVGDGSIPGAVSAADGETVGAGASKAPVAAQPKVEPKVDEVAVDPRTGRGEGCLTDPSVLDDIQSQRDQLARREKDLAAKEAEMKSREQAVSEQIKKLEQIRADIAKTEALHKQDSEEKVAKLVDMMQTMSPKSAARVMSELDETLAVATMDKMETVKLAKIMNNLEPKKSSRLSEILAGVVRARDVAAAVAAHPDAVRGPASTEPNRTNTGNQSEKGGVNNDGHNK